MKEKKPSDFIRSLNLDQDEILDLVHVGCRRYFMEGVSIDDCIREMRAAVKDKDNANVIMFVCGMLFGQALTSPNVQKGASLLLARSMLNEILHKDEDKFPFTHTDLLKSVKEEIDKRE